MRNDAYYAWLDTAARNKHNIVEPPRVHQKTSLELGPGGRLEGAGGVLCQHRHFTHARVHGRGDNCCLIQFERLHRQMETTHILQNEEVDFVIELPVYIRFEGMSSDTHEIYIVPFKKEKTDE